MLDMAASTLIFIGYVVLLQVSNNSTITAVGYSPEDVCPAGTLEQVWSSKPPCKPRKILVKLPLPEDGDVLEVIPAQIEVARCGGVCHEGNLYHKCVPKSGARKSKSVQAVFRKVNAEIGNPGITCATIEVEEHTDCKCGCDVEAASCTELQNYDHYFCKCRCMNNDDRHLCLRDRRRKIWDEKQCRCLCRPEEYRECSTGFVYDPVESCKCVRVGTRGFGSGIEPTTNIAGAEIVAPLIILLLIFFCSTVYLAWRLKQSNLVSSTNDPANDVPEQVLVSDEAATDEATPGESDALTSVPMENLKSTANDRS